MTRPSKLTPAQWSEIERRYLMGEVPRALGREFGVSETAIRKRFAAHQKPGLQSLQVRNVAEKLAEAEIALQALPLVHRPVALDLAEKLRSISHSVAAAAELGAKTGHRLHALANSEVAKVDDANIGTEVSLVAMRNVGVLTKLGNDALNPALTLLHSNKERLNQAGTDEGEADPALLTDAQLAYRITKG